VVSFATHLIVESGVLVDERSRDVREIAVTKGKIADILRAKGNLDGARQLQEERLDIAA